MQLVLGEIITRIAAPANRKHQVIHARPDEGLNHQDAKQILCFPWNLRQVLHLPSEGIDAVVQFTVAPMIAEVKDQ